MVASSVNQRRSRRIAHPVDPRSRPTATRATLVWVSIVLACCLTPGCGKRGPPRGIVQGRVTIGDRPVTDARVMFTNADTGEAIHVAIDGQGIYEAKSYKGPGLVTGTYKVAILPGRIRYSEANQPPMTSKQFELSKAASTLPASDIPKRFRSVDTSGLSIEVRAGDNPPFDFVLEP